MALRGTRKNALRNLDARLPGVSCVTTRRDRGRLSTQHRDRARGRRSSSVPTSITDAISTTTSSQPSVMNKSTATMRLTVGVEIISRPTNSRSVSPAPACR
jgi:hypothetical protein